MSFNPPATRVRSEPQQVIVRDSGVEIHGYAVETDGEWVYVVWAVASGRCRRRKARTVDVFLPSLTAPWTGLKIRPERLRIHHGSAL